MTDPTLYGLAEELLARVLQCFTQAGVEPPARQLIYMSPIPADCSQLAVVFSGWQPVPELDGVVVCQPYRWAGGFSVIISRETCAIPDRKGNPPTVDLMQQAAAVASADAEVLLCLANSIKEAGEQNVSVSPPQGQIQTVTLDLLLPAFGGLE